MSEARPKGRIDDRLDNSLVRLRSQALSAMLALGCATAQEEVQPHSGGNCSRYGISGLRHAGVTSRWRARGYPVRLQAENQHDRLAVAAHDAVLHAGRHGNTLFPAGLIGDHSASRRLIGGNLVQYFSARRVEYQKIAV